jgi:ABC-type glutathione transport system ATPase component
MDALLTVRHLAVEFFRQDGQRQTALDGVSFDIARGEIAGLMGESGSGKSTTALALLGLLPDDSARVTGSAALRGRNLLSLTEREWQEIRGGEMSLVFQEPEIALSPALHAGDQVAEVIHAHRDWNWGRCRSAAKSALERVGLPGDRFFLAYPHQLSGGQRQRVVLAQALACEPALLIADEPTASLDARNQAEFLALLDKLRRQMGLGVLLISHSPEVQAAVADRLLILKEGRILEQGTFESLSRTPKHDYTQSLLRDGRSARCDAGDPQLERVS